MTQPQPVGGFNWARLSMGSKGLLVSSLILLISLFLPWQALRGCEELANAIIDVPCTVSGFAGFGSIVALLAIGVLVWEGMLAAGVNITTGTMSPALIGAIAGGATALFGLIKFLTALGGGPLDAYTMSWGAFVGLVAVLAVAYAAYVRFQESKVGTAPPPPAV